MRRLFRAVGFVALVGACIAIPKMLSEGKFSETVRSLLGTGAETQETQEHEPAWATEMSLVSSDGAPLDGLGQAPVDVALPVPERRLIALDHFLRFDVTPDWVTATFEHVAILPTPGGQGMRVALITGTRPMDLAGSLTYHFDRKKMLQRLSLEATTGDASELVAYVKRHFRLRDAGSGVYINQYNRVILGGLLVRRASLVVGGGAGGWTIDLELNRHGKQGRVSRPFHERLYESTRTAAKAETRQ